jgi:hypothetical protein
MENKYEGFAKNIFRAIQKNDLTLWLSLQTVDEEVKAALQLLAGMRDEALKDRVGQWLSNKRLCTERMHQDNLALLRQEGERSGVVWEKAVFQNIECCVKPPPGFPLDGIEVNIFFKLKDRLYTMGAFQVKETPSGYRLDKITTAWSITKAKAMVNCSQPIGMG